MSNMTQYSNVFAYSCNKMSFEMIQIGLIRNQLVKQSTRIISVKSVKTLYFTYKC